MSDSGGEVYTQQFQQGCGYLLADQERQELLNDNEYETESSQNGSPPSASESTACSTSDEQVDLRRSVFLRLYRRIKCLLKVSNAIPARSSFFPKLRADLAAAVSNLDTCILAGPPPKKKRLLVHPDSDVPTDESESIVDKAESVDDEAEHSSDKYSDDVIEVLSSADEQQAAKRKR